MDAYNKSPLTWIGRSVEILVITLFHFWSFKVAVALKIIFTSFDFVAKLYFATPFFTTTDKSLKDIYFKTSLYASLLFNIFDSRGLLLS